MTAEVLAGVAQLVERQPSKLNVAGSNPVSRSQEVFFMEIEPQSQPKWTGLLYSVHQGPRTAETPDEVTGANAVSLSLSSLPLFARSRFASDLPDIVA